MQLVLIILAGSGALLFIVSFLAYVVSGFRHHFVTGLISALPVLNIVTLPSLWDRSSGKFLTGFVGLIITAGAWFLGADNGVRNLLANRSMSSEETVIVSATPNQVSSTNTDVTVTKRQNSSFSFNEKNMDSLPNKPLYKMAFDVVPVTNITSLTGRIVRITKNNNEQIEGRIISVSASGVILDGTVESELPIASIKQLQLMIKKVN